MIYNGIFSTHLPAGNGIALRSSTPGMWRPPPPPEPPRPEPGLKGVIPDAPTSLVPQRRIMLFSPATQYQP